MHINRLAVAVAAFLVAGCATVACAQSGAEGLSRYGVCSGLDESCYTGWVDRVSGDVLSVERGGTR